MNSAKLHSVNAMKGNFMKGQATVVYDPARPGLKTRNTGWAVANVKGGHDIHRYYEYWIKKIINPLDIQVQGSLKKYPFVNVCQPSWGTHISLVRGEFIKPHLRNLWKKYAGKTFDFEYELDAHEVTSGYNKDDQGSFWVTDIKSDDLLNIRAELGLKTDWPLHMTVARIW